ncbi:MAG: SprT family zinc-dependent metalloprotease [Pseudomonadota bacterium]
MKPRVPSIAKVLQRALQLDFFSELLFPEKLNPELQPQTAADSPQATPPTTTSPKRPTSFTHPNSNRKIQLPDATLEYVLLRSKRRTIGFQITEEGLRVTAPRWVTVANIDDAIQEKQQWIINNLNERRKRTERRLETAMRWEDGASFLFLGQVLYLRLRRDDAVARITAEYQEEPRELSIQLPLGASEQQLKDSVKTWLQKEAKSVFSTRLPVYADMLGVSYKSMSLSNAATRWGSCTSQGKIHLNWRLIHFAPELIDYVIAHELAHLHEMNHSPRFWARVESVFPDYEQARQRLKRHASAELPVF